MTEEPWSDPFADQPGWAPRTPSPIVPVPAAGNRDLRGRRVLMGLPGIGWRTDLRADDKVVQHSRTYVPIMPEHEWYRAESEQIEVFAPLAPIERIWLEAVAANAEPTDPHADVLSRLVSLDTPPRRDPVPVVDAGPLTGRRIVETTESGFERRDLRAVTELYSGADGDICIRVTAELDWYRWGWSGNIPKTREVAVHLLWVE